MDSLLARYFDGDLSDGEARELLDAAENDPDLEKELRAYERVLSIAKALPSLRAPARFTERVMKSITAERKRGRFEMRPAFLRPQWAGVALTAAVVVVAFIGGLWAGGGRVFAPVPAQETRLTAETRELGLHQAVQAGTTRETGPRYVRLVYVPGEATVQSVAVAGSFNNWDPVSTPLRREDGVWSTILVLPAGSYEYMFVENGERWVTDPLAARTRDDGFGTTNAVLDVEM